MRVALTGVTGFLGSAMARALHGAGHSVPGGVGAPRAGGGVVGFVVRFVVGDQADEGCWGALLEGADCVVHNSLDWSMMRPEPPDMRGHLRSNLEGSVMLLHASGMRQFVFISTMAVHHGMMPRPVGPDGVRVVDEDHPLRPSTEYGAYKAAVEAHLWAEHYGKGRNTSAVRPCAVYGIDRDLPRSHGYREIEALRAGERYARTGGGKFVHVDDVSAAVVGIVGNDAAAGRAFNLVDCYARWADWAAMAARVLEVEADIDFSSPERPENMFDKTAARSLGVGLDRGHAGIEAHLRGLVGVMG